MANARFRTVAALVLTSALASGCATRVRPNVATLSPTAVASLRTGVSVMKGRMSSDKTSWDFQAGMHNTDCQHGSYFFLAWHRMYLYYFERILRAASGDKTLTLPYWNWSDPSTASLPDIFRNPANATNSLYTPLRDATINAGGTLPASITDYSTAFAYVNFDDPTNGAASFGGLPVAAPQHGGSGGGSLELSPHNPIHPAVGGAGGLMTNVATAAQDPIFWLHHANIDRLWSQWLRQGGGRADPTGDTTWMNTTFTFYDESGTAVTLTGAQIMNSITQLSYRYDDEPADKGVPWPTSPLPTPAPPAPVRPAANLVAASALSDKAWLTHEPLKVELPFTTDGSALALAALARPGGRIALRVEGIDFEQTPADFYEVYLNPPAGELDYKNPSYVGNLSFFGLKYEHGHGAPPAAPPSRTFDLTRRARALEKEGAWRAPALTVRFVRRGVIPPAGKKEEVVPGVRATFTRIVVVAE